MNTNSDDRADAHVPGANMQLSVPRDVLVRQTCLRPACCLPRRWTRHCTNCHRCDRYAVVEARSVPAPTQPCASRRRPLTSIAATSRIGTSKCCRPIHTGSTGTTTGSDARPDGHRSAQGVFDAPHRHRRSLAGIKATRPPGGCRTRIPQARPERGRWEAMGASGHQDLGKAGMVRTRPWRPKGPDTVRGQN